MSFQRARTDEQRNERRRQILGTAAAMLTEVPVAELTLTALSRRVCLAKANVLRYFESREAVLLELLEAEMAGFVAGLEGEAAPPGGPASARANRLAGLLASALADRPVLCDLLSAQATVLERNISAETAIRHKRTAGGHLRSMVRLTSRHVPEIGDEGARTLLETVLLVAMAAWPHSRPPQPLLAAYDADPAVAATRIDFTDVVRRTAEVTAAGLLARAETVRAQGGPGR